MPSTLKNQIESLTKQVENLTNVVKSLVPDGLATNKDGIPVGTNVYANVDIVGEVVLTTLPKAYQVKKIGSDKIYEGHKFNSLSAAAEAFSNITRKSGWIFWHNVHGKTLKEVYKG
jgi:hypothetical protein